MGKKATPECRGIHSGVAFFALRLRGAFSYCCGGGLFPCATVAEGFFLLLRGRAFALRLLWRALFAYCGGGGLFPCAYCGGWLFSCACGDRLFA